jgi:hypothetical protein
MPTSPEPATIVFDTSPDQPRTRAAQVFPAPADAGITAAIEGDPAFRVEGIVVLEHLPRPATSDELSQLPPWLQDEVAKTGVLEWQETGASDGVTPLAVNDGSTVRVNVGVAPRSQRAAGIATGTLVVGGASWSRTRVPLVALDNTPTVVATAMPPAIGRVAAPGEIPRPYVVLDNVPDGATVLPALDRATFVRIEETVRSEERPAGPE